MIGHRARHLAPYVLNEMTGSVAGHDGVRRCFGRLVLTGAAVFDTYGAPLDVHVAMGRCAAGIGDRRLGRHSVWLQELFSALPDALCVATSA